MRNQNVKILSLFLILIFILYGCDKSKGDWNKAKELNTIEGYSNFIANHGQSKLVSTAQLRIEELSWDKASRDGTIESYKKFIALHPQSKFMDIARQRIEELAWGKAIKDNTIEAYQIFLNEYPQSKFADAAKQKVDADIKKMGKPDDFYFMSSLIKDIDGVSYVYPYSREKSEWNPFAKNYIVVYTKPATPVNPLIFVYLNKLADTVKKSDVVLLPSLDSYLAEAQSILKDVEPTGNEFSDPQGTFIKVQARAESLAYIRASKLLPAACFPNVRTYLQIRGSEEKPLWIGRNIKVWNGELYFDGHRKILLKNGTSFQFLDGPHP